MSNLHTEKLLLYISFVVVFEFEAALGSNPAAGLLPSIDGE